MSILNKLRARPARRAWLAVAVLLLTGLFPASLPAQDQQPPPKVQAADVKLGDRLTGEQAAAFAHLALKGLNQEFPNKPSNVLESAESVKTPRELYPAFYGCFDWHSSVHGHWLLVRLLKEYPNHPLAAESRTALAEHLTAENLQHEADHFAADANKSFERMYGWAWLLRLSAELKTWDDEDSNGWAKNLQPLEDVIVGRIKDYLPKLQWPIRVGVHQDTGFALGQIFDYAKTIGDDELAALVAGKAVSYYMADKAYPAAYEPSGEDFFSSGLNEADMMRRILPANDFAAWLEEFFPGLRNGELGNVLQPVSVSDVTDGKIVHLAGLNMNRAWTMRGIASALPANDPRRQILEDSAADHATAGLQYVFSGHYEGEHWLATFAVYVLTNVAVD
ncbi:MAG: DUF2891 domain-containing protein [Pirellulales bacterium]|nr:DUF2891 domain-containing protein [Pirellulales bacterium]